MTLSMWINPLGGTGDQVAFAKFWSGTMTSPYYQYGMELDGGVTPHFYIGTAGGADGRLDGHAARGEPMEPPRGRLQRVAGTVLREREPGGEPAAERDHHRARLAALPRRRPAPDAVLPRDARRREALQPRSARARGDGGHEPRPDRRAAGHDRADASRSPRPRKAPYSPARRRSRRPPATTSASPASSSSSTARLRGPRTRSPRMRRTGTRGRVRTAPTRLPRAPATPITRPRIRRP